MCVVVVAFRIAPLRRLHRRAGSPRAPSPPCCPSRLDPAVGYHGGSQPRFLCFMATNTHSECGLFLYRCFTYKALCSCESPFHVYKVQYALPGIRYQVTFKMQRRTCRAKPEDPKKKLDIGSNSKRHISHRKKKKKLSDTSVRQNKPQRQSKLHPQDHTTAASPRPWLK